MSTHTWSLCPVSIATLGPPADRCFLHKCYCLENAIEHDISLIWTQLFLFDSSETKSKWRLLLKRFAHMSYQCYQKSEMNACCDSRLKRTGVRTHLRWSRDCSSGRRPTEILYCIIIHLHNEIHSHVLKYQFVLKPIKRTHLMIVLRLQPSYQEMFWKRSQQTLIERLVFNHVLKTLSFSETVTFQMLLLVSERSENIWK